jgi:hypothetical protein
VCVRMVEPLARARKTVEEELAEATAVAGHSGC